MKSRYVIGITLIMAMLITGLTCAQVTIQASSGETGSVYTTGSIYVDSSPAGS